MISRTPSFSPTNVGPIPQSKTETTATSPMPAADASSKPDAAQPRRNPAASHLGNKWRAMLKDTAGGTLGVAAKTLQAASPAIAEHIGTGLPQIFDSASKGLLKSQTPQGRALGMAAKLAAKGTRLAAPAITSFATDLIMGVGERLEQARQELARNPELAKENLGATTVGEEFGHFGPGTGFTRPSHGMP